MLFRLWASIVHGRQVFKKLWYILHSTSYINPEYHKSMIKWTKEIKLCKVFIYYIEHVTYLGDFLSIWWEVGIYYTTQYIATGVMGSKFSKKRIIFYYFCGFITGFLCTLLLKSLEMQKTSRGISKAWKFWCSARKNLNPIYDLSVPTWVDTV